MNKIIMSHVFDGGQIGFPPYWSDKKCVYANAAIMSYDLDQATIELNQATIAKQAETIADHCSMIALQQVQIEQANQALAATYTDNTEFFGYEVKGRGE